MTRTDQIGVKKPVWVRIVNPDPFEVLGRTYRYGDVLWARPGGRFLVLGRLGDRVLAVYGDPHGPTEPSVCPEEAMVFMPERDLLLAAEGRLHYVEPYDRPIPICYTAPYPPALKLAKLGDRVTVPRTREARVWFQTETILSPYVEDRPFLPTVYRENVRPFRDLILRDVYLRAGGCLTVAQHDGPFLVAVYRSSGDARRPECASGAHVYVSEADFLRMGRDARSLREAEAYELAEVRALLSNP